MKKLILILLTAVSATVAMAQINPQPGYVITNTGDTIRGTIDFRTNERLSRQCEFWANGESKTYKPGEIEGFRFDNNGKYFVSRRLNITGTAELYFAEFMVQGKMNLYCVPNNGDEYFFFEREDGEIAQLTNRELADASLSYHNAMQRAKDNMKEKREQYGKVKLLLQQSRQAVEDMEEEKMSRKKLVKVVRDYHNDVCTDGSKCMVYEYKEESDKVKSALKLIAGYASYTKQISQNQLYSNHNNTGQTFEFGLGAEVELERVIKGFSIEAGLTFSPQYRSKLFGNSEFSTRHEMNILTLSVGAVKRFGNGKIQPLVRGGVFFARYSGVKDLLWRQAGNSVWSWPANRHSGIYLGAGAQIQLGKRYARIHADWYKSTPLFRAPDDEPNMMRLGITAEFAVITF